VIADNFQEAKTINVNEEPLIFKAVLYWVYNKDYKSVVGPNNKTVTVDLDFFLKVYNMAVKVRNDLPLLHVGYI
jgi:hypothetical protein